MGLLDDAIREHLDLQRRRGADPTEVERAEREALGPVRRVQAPDDAESDEAAEQIDPADGGAFDHEDEDHQTWAFEDELAASHADAPVPGGQSEPDLKPLREAEGMGQETAVHRPAFLDEEEVAEPDLEARHPDLPPAHPAPENVPAPHPASEPAAPGAEGDPGEQGSGGENGEELLEETPEFLQDTPDHDRLWFEQRPPKDFDFDG